MRRACSEAVREWAAPAGGVVDAGSGVSRSGNSTDGISGSSAAGVAGAESGSATGFSDLGFLVFFFLRSSSIWRGGVSVVVEGVREVLKVDAPSFWRRPVFRLWQPLRRRLRSRPLVVNWSGVRWVWFWLDVRWRLKMSLKMEVWMSRARCCYPAETGFAQHAYLSVLALEAAIEAIQAPLVSKPTPPGPGLDNSRYLGHLNTSDWLGTGNRQANIRYGNEAPSGSADAPKAEGPRHGPVLSTITHNRDDPVSDCCCC